MSPGGHKIVKKRGRIYRCISPEVRPFFLNGRKSMTPGSSFGGLPASFCGRRHRSQSAVKARAARARPAVAFRGLLEVGVSEVLGRAEATGLTKVLGVLVFKHQ